MRTYLRGMLEDGGGIAGAKIDAEAGADGEVGALKRGRVGMSAEARQPWEGATCGSVRSMGAMTRNARETGHLRQPLLLTLTPCRSCHYRCGCWARAADVVLARLRGLTGRTLSRALTLLGGVSDAV